MNSRELELLRILEARRGEYVSGRELASILGVSKPTLNRIVNALKKKGYIIDSNPRKGYRLLPVDDLANTEFYLADLGTRLRYRVHYVEKCVTTQDIAATLAEQGATEGTIVLAEEMNGGRGRLSRKWYAPRGGLWFTLILRPHDTRYSQLLSLAIGLGIVKGIENNLGIRTSLKWPNDVLYNEEKLAGILVEGKIEVPYIKYILVGVGVNVNNEIPLDLRDTAISLKDILKRHVPRIPLLRSMLLEIDKYYNTLVFRGDYKRIIAEWKNYSSTIGRRVKAITVEGRTIVGKAVDIDKTGALILETPSGIEKIYAGDIIHLR